MEAVGPVFAGRTAELAALRAAHARARAGDAAAVLIGAEAGGGKTRLVAEFTRDLHALTGGCLDLGAGLPYAPFTAILRRLGRDAVTELMPAAALPELARLLPGLSDAAPPPDDGTGRLRLFEHVLTLAERLGAREPVVLVVENAHWADRSTRDLLTFLLHNPPRGAVLPVVTFRAEEPESRPLFAELSRLPHVTRLDLPPLAPDEVADLVHGIRGDAGPAAVRDVHARSGGNPLFAEALAREPGAAVPGSLRALLAARLDRLPAPAGAALRAASAAGERVGHDLLATVTELPDAELSAALRPAVEHDLLVTDGDGYAFRHALVREAVLRDLLPGERASLHRRYAEAIERAPELAESPASALAVHWAGCGDHAGALAAAWRAAGERRAATAYAEQLTLLERVLELWARVPDAETLTGRPRHEVLEAAAEAAVATGDPHRGLPLVERALEGADRVREPERAAVLLAHRAALRGYHGDGDELGDLREAERLAAGPGPARVRILAQASARLLVYGDASGERLGREGLELARALGPPGAARGFEVTVAAAAARDGAGDHAPLERLLRGDLDAWESTRVLNMLAHCRLTTGRADDALALATEGLAVAERAGLAHSIGLAPAVNRVEALYRLGRWDEAAESVRTRLARHHGPAFRVQMTIWRIALRAARGRGPEPGPEIAGVPLDAGFPQTALPLAQMIVEWRLADDDRAAARATVDAVLRHPRLTAQPCHLWPLLESAAHAGGPCLPQIAALAARLPAATPPAAAHSAAVTALTGEDPGAARDAWCTAIAVWEELGQPYPLARALLGAARADLAAGDRASAAGRLERAAGIAGPLGAAPLARTIGEQARRAGPPGSPRGPLTARESEVLRLLVRGRSNRGIAEELFISPKTASVHVSNILAKLGVASRGEAAAAARDRGLA
ncbi:helix-turn-helix transcriptional regulator [Actinomadura algeriensis]|uniref:DNA-binding CsgD family transcriptional regulator n=1 Tax=Actinomadura algeriensis TaxID=1679523 RepID=A0ABR9JZ22_9ACTN|nr:helix-turn-helix transcriptional regulator [Actinomadura algeriensis]MBE1535822.1 DNA-binding CsgD family transcriptional regulator [Actinomadura algeriensis]